MDLIIVFAVVVEFVLLVLKLTEESDFVVAVLIMVVEMDFLTVAAIAPKLDFLGPSVVMVVSEIEPLFAVVEVAEMEPLTVVAIAPKLDLLEMVLIGLNSQIVAIIVLY